MLVDVPTVPTSLSTSNDTRTVSDSLQLTISQSNHQKLCFDCLGRRFLILNTVHACRSCG